MIYSLYRWALLYPNSYCFYIAPFKDQIKDLVWANGRMPHFLPDKLMTKYGVTINNSDFRVIFRNGSYIKAEGSDNYEKSRGFSATGLAVYDEKKDIHPKFHEGFEPNLAITDAPLMMVGTPPSFDEPSFEEWVSTSEEIKNSPVGFYIHRSSMTNPHVNKEFFIRKESELILKGEKWKWDKEYLALLVRAGDRGIFPMLSSAHVRPYNDVLTEILNSHHDWDFHVAFDPGSATCFAVLFGAVHKYSKKVYLLDEIYATNFAQNSVGVIIEEVKAKINEIMPDISRWSGVYDYAATWFWNEYQSNYDFGLFINKCEKDLKNKENKLSLMKDMLLGGFLCMTDKCVKFYWEMSKYSTDDNGKIRKENDHLLDASRYMLNDMRYDKIPCNRPLTEEQLMVNRRRVTIQEDLQEAKSGDIYGDIDTDLFDN